MLRFRCLPVSVTLAVHSVFQGFLGSFHRRVDLGRMETRMSLH